MSAMISLFAKHVGSWGTIGGKSKEKGQKQAHLPSVQLKPTQPLILLVPNLLHAHILQIFHLVQKHPPDLLPSFDAQLAIPQSNMNPRREGRIEDRDSIGSQEQYALKVFQHAEEDGDEGVATDIIIRALFEEDIGFVEKEERAPGMGDVKDLSEIAFDVAAFYAQFAY